MKFFDPKGVLCALFLTCMTYAKPVVLNDDKILNDAVSAKILSIANELYSSCGVSASIGVYNSLNSQTPDQFFKNISVNFSAPYAFLMLSKDDRHIEIFADPETMKLFDKEQILSPYPGRGTILPIITTHNAKDVYNAALLNGYADLAEQIARAKGVTLTNAVGNANKDTINVIRYIFYGGIFLVVAVLFYRRQRRKFV